MIYILLIFTKDMDVKGGDYIDQVSGFNFSDQTKFF